MNDSGASSSDDDLRAQLLEATALLRRVAGAKDLLAPLSVEERTALLNAAGDVFCGDADERRLRVKARRKAQRAQKIRRDDEVLSETGIRTLRVGYNKVFGYYIEVSKSFVDQVPVLT